MRVKARSSPEACFGEAPKPAREGACAPQLCAKRKYEILWRPPLTAETQASVGRDSVEPGATEATSPSGSTESRPTNGSTESRPSGSTESRPTSGSTESRPTTGSTKSRPTSGSTESRPTSGSTESRPTTERSFISIFAFARGRGSARNPNYPVNKSLRRSEASLADARWFL